MQIVWSFSGRKRGCRLAKLYKRYFMWKGKRKAKQEPSTKTGFLKIIKEFEKNVIIKFIEDVKEGIIYFLK